MRHFFILLLIGAVVFPLMTLAVSDREQEIIDIEAEAEALTPDDEFDEPTIEELTGRYGITRDPEAEALGKELMDKVYADYLFSYEGLLRAERVYDSMLFLISYNYGTTAELGPGERAGSIASWRSALIMRNPGVYVPRLQGDWENILKIANGRWPSEGFRDSRYEDFFIDEFQAIYLHEPDRTNPNDDAAMMIMSYGLRPDPRNVESEKAAIGYFGGIFGRQPTSTADWDIVRAIAYSGASR